MKNAARSIILITASAFGIASPAAFAETAANDATKNPVFLKLDVNHDGFVSRREAKQDPAIAALFDQADSNRDGRLSEDELIKALSIGQREGAAQYARDAETTARVKTALLQSEGLKSLEISVKTDRGRVQLAGFVDSKNQIAQAGKVASSETGVKSVLNDLKLK